MTQIKNEVAKGLYFTGLLVLVTGLPLSMFLMSFGQIILLSGWIISGNLVQKLKYFFTNPVTLLISSVFFLHIVGFAWSSDLIYAVKDSRIKFPLFLLPLIISTTEPLTEKNFLKVLYVFIAAIIIATFISIAVLLGFTSHKVHDIRDISIFISHIRFGLLISIAIFCCIWLVIKNYKNQGVVQNGILICSALWLLIFLIILEALTSLIILLVATFCLGIIFIYRHPDKRFKAFFIIPVLLIAWLFVYVKQITREVTVITTKNFSKLDHFTSRGNPYVLDAMYDDTENGNAVWMYTCPMEIDSVWPARSKLSIKGKDEKGQLLYYTLIRYMASKGLRKDADGINSLSENDIKYIEAGYTNYRFTNTSSLNARIYQIVWEFYHYKKHGNPQGHSVTQRLEFWKTGWSIFKQHPFTGVGTGDVQEAFNNQYALQQSLLPKEWRLRAHNQYLTFAISFGLFGLLLFLVSLFYPWIKLNKTNDILYCLFLLTALLSFCNEDTLETQAGVTFYAFFNSFFLFCKRDK